MNSSLSTFMKIAITAVTISAFVFGAMYLALDGISVDVNNYITSSG